jgi:tRNA-guanine family transglycosylase
MRVKELIIKGRKYKLPIFLPDATLGVVRGLDKDILEKTGVRGVVVNTYHLNDEPGIDILKKYAKNDKVLPCHLTRQDLVISNILFQNVHPGTII